MTNPVRYSIKFRTDGAVEVVPTANGEFVTYQDYALLEKSLNVNKDYKEKIDMEDSSFDDGSGWD